MQQKTREPARGTSLTILIRIHWIFSILLTVLWTPWTIGSQTGRFPKPIMEVEPRIVSWAQSASVRCSAQKGDRCHFYTNESHVPFKTVPFKDTFGLCRSQVMWNEVAVSSHNVLLVSCAVEVNVEGGNLLSPRSDGQIFQVIGVPPPISHPPKTPRVWVWPNVTAPHGQVQLICEAPSSVLGEGPLCRFYALTRGGGEAGWEVLGGPGSSWHDCRLNVTGAMLLGPRPWSQWGPRVEVLVHCDLQESAGAQGNQSWSSGSVMVLVWVSGSAGDALPAGLIAGTLIPILIAACLLGLYLTYRKATLARPRSEEARRTESDREHQESLYENVSWA